jgi:hypothetical protein
VPDQEVHVKRSRRLRPFPRTLALAAVCSVAVFAFVGSATASGGRPVDARHQALLAKATEPVVRAGDTAATRAPVVSTPTYRAGDIAASRAPVVSSPSYRAGDSAVNRVPVISTLPEAPAPSVKPIVVNHGDQTLALVLAASALGLALAAAGVMLVKWLPRPLRTH